MAGLCQFNWVIEGRLFYVRWPEAIDAEGARLFKDGVLNYLAQSSSPKTHYISDTRPLKHLPTISEVRDTVSLLKQDTMGWTVTLAPNQAVVRMMVQILIRLTPLQVQFVDDVDMAIAFLAEVDPTLPDLAPYRDRIIALSS
jgi:hypothetical protein